MESENILSFITIIVIIAIALLLPSCVSNQVFTDIDECSPVTIYLILLSMYLIAYGLIKLTWYVLGREEK